MSGLPMKTRVENLETSMQDLREIVARTSLQVERTSAGLAEFKEENRLFREEMREFKEEMREFKDEMKEFKDDMVDVWRIFVYNSVYRMVYALSLIHI